MNVKLFLVFLLSLVLAGAAAGCLLYTELKQWGEHSREISEIVVDIPRGTSLRKTSELLESAQVIDSAWRYELWARLFSPFRRYKAGTYRFEQRVSPRLAAEKLVAGEVYVPVVFTLAVPEGFTVAKVFERLSAGGIASADELKSLQNDAEFLKSLRIPTLEGYLYPATYPFTTLPSGRAVIEQAVRTFWEKLPADYEARAQAKQLSLREAVIFASLIEHETAQADERERISEVIWNRLNKKTPLGIDAALIYGIKDYAGDITWKHLADTSNPYNTRIHPGLPPTPICSPSTASLLAVLNPTSHGYNYYVVDADLGDRHHFSKTIEEHNRQVRKYLKAERQK